MRTQQNQFIQTMSPGSLACFFSDLGPLASQSGWPGQAQVDPNFLYLLDLFEVPALLVLRRGFNGGVTRSLFCRPSDPQAERWHGPWMGLERAQACLEVDEVYPYAQAAEVMRAWLQNIKELYIGCGTHQIPAWLRDLILSARQSCLNSLTVRRWDSVLHRLRLMKTPVELKKIERACRITQEAFLNLLREWSTFERESEIQGALYRVFSERQAAPAYPAIVASGSRGNFLHYHQNDQSVAPGELVLIDAGCQWRGYTSDVTRTIPRFGQFTGAQKEIYSLVLEAQRAAQAEVFPGGSVQAAELAARRTVVRGLTQLGVLAGNEEALLAASAERAYFMHSIGHWLGLEVHDVGPRRGADGRPTVLKPGMVLTLEPGLYFQEGVGSKYDGICVRLEDVFVVTETGNRNLTEGIPIEPEEIERHVARGE